MVERVSLKEFRLTMQRRTPLQPEFHLQKNVATYLDLVLPPESFWCAIPNGAVTGAREAAKLKRLGLKPGAPDLAIWFAGKSLLIELKAIKGRLTELQREVHHRLERAGVTIAVCRSIEDVRRALAAFGIPLIGARP